jgi:hypothetical protein
MLDGSEDVVPNLGQGFTKIRGVYEDYDVIEGRLGPRSYEIVRWYAPSLYPEIPGELAKLPRGDVDAVLKFARTYGELGHTAFIPHEVWARGGATPVGDPLPWVWAHADTLTICLELSYLLQEDDMASLRTYLHSLRVTQQDIEERCGIVGNMDNMMNRSKIWPTAVVAIRGEITVQQWGWLNQTTFRNDDDVKDLARRIRRSLINGNIAGIHRMLFDDGAKDSLFWEFRALIEMAYWHVATAVDGRRFMRCEANDCKKLFVHTDQRQRFCPPMFGQKQESRCAVRHRVHKHRQKDSGERCKRLGRLPG